jgi:predicted HicB family RNase H-like nuclease
MAEHFTYRVSWSQEDGEHVGTCLEFPSLSHLAADPAEALDGVRKLVADVVADMQANNELILVPRADTRYSGKFMTRIPPDLHRRLAIEAEEEQISLNRLVSARLSAPAMAWVHRLPTSGAMRKAGVPAQKSRIIEASKVITHEVGR